MVIRLNCECGYELRVADRMAGRRGRCPECDAVLLVPGESGDDVLDDLPRPSSPSSFDAGGAPRGPLRFLSRSLVVFGNASGLATAAFSVYVMVVVLRGEPGQIPFGLFEDLRPRFMSSPTTSGILIGGIGLAFSFVPYFVFGGMGHVLRLFMSLDDGLRDLLDRLSDAEG